MLVLQMKFFDSSISNRHSPRSSRAPGGIPPCRRAHRRTRPSSLPRTRTPTGGGKCRGRTPEGGCKRCSWHRTSPCGTWKEILDHRPSKWCQQSLLFKPQPQGFKAALALVKGQFSRTLLQRACFSIQKSERTYLLSRR